jgi:hypothetical protein
MLPIGAASLDTAFPSLPVRRAVVKERSRTPVHAGRLVEQGHARKHLFPSCSVRASPEGQKGIARCPQYSARSAVRRPHVRRRLSGRPSRARTQPSATARSSARHTSRRVAPTVPHGSRRTAPGSRLASRDSTLDRPRRNAPTELSRSRNVPWNLANIHCPTTVPRPNQNRGRLRGRRAGGSGRLSASSRARAWCPAESGAGPRSNAAPCA